MRITALDLRWNIAALTIAICSEKYMLPEEVFSILEDKHLSVDYEDVKDMLVMKEEGMTYREIGEVYGVNRGTVYGRVRRHKDKQKKTSQTAI